MMQYSFYDTDIYGYESYDIRGNEYKELISTCCRYSKTLSLLFPVFITVTSELTKFEIERPTNLSLPGALYSPYQFQARYFPICPEVKEILLHAVDGVFEWLPARGHLNPMDPIFYREDGSIFFESTTHEGECILTPLPGEDVEHIISNPLWMHGKRKPF